MRVELKKAPTAPTGFRPWPDIEKRLEFAQMLGVSRNQAINEGLKRGLRKYLQELKAEKAKTVTEALNGDIP